MEKITEPIKEKKFLTVSEFRQSLDCAVTRQHVYRMISAGEVPVRKIGGKMVIDGEWARAYINQPFVRTKKVPVPKTQDKTVLCR